MKPRRERTPTMTPAMAPEERFGDELSPNELIREGTRVVY